MEAKKIVLRPSQERIMAYISGKMGIAAVPGSGKTWTLSELKGQVVFVNFWATWCPPCREEMPSMERLYRAMPKDRFKMLAILNKDDPGLADSFARQFGLSMPILDDQANQATDNRPEG